MYNVRQLQARHEKSMRAKILFEARREAEIKKTIESSHLVQALDTSGDLAAHIFRSMRAFEKLCKRHNVEVNNALRPSMLHILASEFVVNREALPSARLKDLEALTALQGAIGPELAAAFDGRFKQGAQSHLQRAAMRPSAPKEYLAEIARRQEKRAKKKTWAEKVENWWETEGQLRE